MSDAKKADLKQKCRERRSRYKEKQKLTAEYNLDSTYTGW